MFFCCFSERIWIFPCMVIKWQTRQWNNIYKKHLTILANANRTIKTVSIRIKKKKEKISGMASLTLELSTWFESETKTACGNWLWQVANFKMSKTLANRGQFLSLRIIAGVYCWKSPSLTKCVQLCCVWTQGSKTH